MLSVIKLCHTGLSYPSPSHVELPTSSKSLSDTVDGILRDFVFYTNSRLQFIVGKTDLPLGVSYQVSGGRNSRSGFRVPFRIGVMNTDNPSWGIDVTLTYLPTDEGLTVNFAWSNGKSFRSGIVASGGELASHIIAVAEDIVVHQLAELRLNEELVRLTPTHFARPQLRWEPTKTVSIILDLTPTEVVWNVDTRAFACSLVPFEKVDGELSPSTGIDPLDGLRSLVNHNPNQSVLGILHGGVPLVLRGVVPHHPRRIKGNPTAGFFLRSYFGALTPEKKQFNPFLLSEDGNTITVWRYVSRANYATYEPVFSFDRVSESLVTSPLAYYLITKDGMTLKSAS